MPKEAAGISKFEVRWRFIELAWSTGKEFWLRLADIMIPVDHSGMTLISAFSSSTWSTVQRLHGSEALPSAARSLMIQALFRNLGKANEENRDELVC